MLRSTTTPLVLTLTVARREPEFVRPAKPTPRELKPLSDIDDQPSLWSQVPVMFFYPGGQGNNKRDPARVIRQALAEALVYYYPFAGRLREGPAGKLMVDCTGEGVVFVEAEADAQLQDIRSAGDGGFLHPPFPKELLLDVPRSSGMLDCPLLLFQVTRLRCGGFVFAFSFNHIMTDGAGILQFLNAIAELARGASQPSAVPVWSRELLLSRDPPRVTCTHREFDQVEGPVFPLHHQGHPVIDRSFFFGRAELGSLRRSLQPHLRTCSTFDLLSAFLWRCRTAALMFDPSQEIRYLCLVNARPMLKHPPLPASYYGNAFVFPAAVSTAGELSGNGLDYAVELIKNAKAEVTEEYVRSVTDLMATQGRPPLTLPGTWLVSDITKFRYLDIDFGWGKPVYAGPSSAMVGIVSGPIGFFVKGVNGVGESGIFILICLPVPAMERFAEEIDRAVGKASGRSSNVCSNL